MNINTQKDTWINQFGKDYTDRNLHSPEDVENLYKDRYGVSRSEMNSFFLQDLHLYERKILEVGCNIGNQLILLQRLGFKNLYGIELQDYAIEKAKDRTKGINIIQGDAEDIPFKDEYFDMVFTSGVLIHISPDNIEYILDEIYRCSKEYIWGFEYYAESYVEIDYRGKSNLLWKADFARLYQEKFKDLRLIREKRFQYSNNENIDSMFLLKKTSK